MKASFWTIKKSPGIWVIKTRKAEIKARKEKEGESGKEKVKGKVERVSFEEIKREVDKEYERQKKRTPKKVKKRSREKSR